jgi:hypothetical protein
MCSFLAKLEEGGKEFGEIAYTGTSKVKGRSDGNIRREKNPLLVRKVIALLKSQ